MSKVQAIQGKVKHLRKVEKSYSELPVQLATFLEFYVESGDAKGSWVLAGYSEGTKHHAMSRIRDNWRMVEAMIKERISAHVPLALAGIIELAQNANGETVRLKAQQDILYRAGYDTPVSFVVEDKEASELKDSDLKDELARLLASQAK